MAKTQFELIKTEAVKPLYAVAGAAEMAIVHARGYADEAQKVAQARIKDVQDRVAKISKIERDPKALQGKALTLVNARVEELQGEAKKAQQKFEARLKDLQKDAKSAPRKFEAQLNDAIEELNETYDELTKRGEKFVAAIRKDGVKAVAALQAVPGKSSTRRSIVQTQAAQDRPAAKSTTTKKPAAKKAPAKSTAKKTTAKKSTAKKSTTKQTAKASA